jgi:hypothetical protein
MNYLGSSIVIIVSIFIFILITKSLWNFLMPEIFGLKEIDFWQTFALIILSGIVFGNNLNNTSAMNIMNNNIY